MNPNDMVAKLEQQLMDTPAGVSQVVVDGQTIQFNRAQAIEELSMWQRRAALYNSKTRRKGFGSSIDLGSAW